jgi:hypothetical protein
MRSRAFIISRWERNTESPLCDPGSPLSQTLPSRVTKAVIRPPVTNRVWPTSALTTRPIDAGSPLAVTRPVRSGYEATNVVGLAGEYYRCDGIGFRYRLSILPDGRYSLIDSGCTGVHRRESGYVFAINGEYVLSSSALSEPSITRKFVLIRWGQRHYLIPPDEMQHLRDAIIEGVV